MPANGRACAIAGYLTIEGEAPEPDPPEEKIWIGVWLTVLPLGGVVGARELISPYKDDPWAALNNWSVYQFCPASNRL